MQNKDQFTSARDETTRGMVSRRRLLGFVSSAGVLSLLPMEELMAQTASSDTLRNLQWSESRAEKNWRRAGGPLFMINDHVALYEGGPGGARFGPSEPQLTPEERDKILSVLKAASAYYLAHDLPAPNLPLDGNDVFQVFAVGRDGSVAGFYGTSLGDPAVGDNAGLFERAANILVNVVDAVRSVDEEGNVQTQIERLVAQGSHLVLSTGVYRAYQNSRTSTHPWQPLVTVAHELMHAIDGHSSQRQGWEGYGEWLGEGSVHAVSQFAFKAVGYDPMVVLKSGTREQLKDIGLRPYDVSLALTDRPRSVPQWAMDEPPSAFDVKTDKGRSDLISAFWGTNAAYFTNSFWRYLFKEEAPVKTQNQPRNPGLLGGLNVPFLPGAGGGLTRPGDFELVSPFRRFAMTSSDRRDAGANRWLDPGLVMLHRFLKQHPHPVWGATGLYRSFPAFIAHFVEWPDQVIKSREGFFEHEKWINALFMEGVPKHEIDIGQDITATLPMMVPYSARAIRFTLPELESGSFAEALTGNNFPRVTITVTALSGPRNAIDHIHLGVRGNVLSNLESQTPRSGQGRVRRWGNVDVRPLFRTRTNGESVLVFANSPPNPTMGDPIRIRVHVALQVATAQGQCSYHPMPIPNGDNFIDVPSSVSPPLGGEVPIAARSRDSDRVHFNIMQDADLVRMEAVAVAAFANVRQPQLMAVPRETDQPAQAGLFALAGMGPGVLEARPTTKSRLMVGLNLPRIEPGQVGAVYDATVNVEWYEPMYEAYRRYGISPYVRMETDAVQVSVATSTEAGITGTYNASFDQASGNDNREFRGTIGGRFALGIEHDAEDTERELPEDITALMPTDFFIASARAGIEIDGMLEALEEARQSYGSSASSGAADAGAEATSGSGGSVLGVDECAYASDEEFKAWVRRMVSEAFTTLPPDQIEMLIEQYTAEGGREMARAMSCGLGYFPGGARDL